jgi:hypothetical protein
LAVVFSAFCAAFRGGYGIIGHPKGKVASTHRRLDRIRERGASSLLENFA